MKGMIFNIFEDFICENWSVELYEEIFSRCPLKTKEPFVGPKTYPDVDFIAILKKTCEILEVDVEEGLRAFGKFAFIKLQQKYPYLINDEAGARNFLLTLDSVIHAEIKKIYPEAELPGFSYQDLSESQLIMIYKSKKQLCSLVEGLLEGVADYFDTEIKVCQNKCVKKGDSECEFDLHFALQS